jgi:Domain of unknown function (DUF5659)
MSVAITTKEVHGIRTHAELEVADTLLATFLQTQGYRVLRITGSNPNKRFFVFENGPEVEASIRSYALGTAMCEPHLFGRTYRTLLRMLHRS